RRPGRLRGQRAAHRNLPPADQGAAALPPSRPAGRRRILRVERRAQGDGEGHRLGQPGARRKGAAPARGGQARRDAQGRHQGEAMTKRIEVDGRTYRWMDRPLVVVCVDGCEYDYLSAAAEAGVAPFLSRIMSGEGTAWRADCVIPSFTNPNNLSI